jgi:hypothetical protein
MVPIMEILFVLVLVSVGARWYLRTPMHRARKNSGVHLPTQVAGHMGFGMYSPSDPPLLPHALRDYSKESRDKREPDAEVTPEPGDA